MIKAETASAFYFIKYCCHGLEDDTMKIVINAKGSRENLSQEMKAFLDYLVDQTTTSDFTRALEIEVYYGESANRCALSP